MSTPQTQPANGTRQRNTRNVKPATPEVEPIVIDFDFDEPTTNTLKYRESDGGNPMHITTVGRLYVQKVPVSIKYDGRLPIGFTVTLAPIFE